jgi:hypothetical protein
MDLVRRRRCPTPKCRKPLMTLNRLSCCCVHKRGSMHVGCVFVCLSGGMRTVSSSSSSSSESRTHRHCRSVPVPRVVPRSPSSSVPVCCDCVCVRAALLFGGCLVHFHSTHTSSSSARVLRATRGEEGSESVRGHHTVHHGVVWVSCFADDKKSDECVCVCVCVLGAFSLMTDSPRTTTPIPPRTPTDRGWRTSPARAWGALSGGGGGLCCWACSAWGLAGSRAKPATRRRWQRRHRP